MRQSKHRDPLHLVKKETTPEPVDVLPLQEDINLFYNSLADQLRHDQLVYERQLAATRAEGQQQIPAWQYEAMRQRQFGPGNPFEQQRIAGMQGMTSPGSLYGMGLGAGGTSLLDSLMGRS
jgi:hypothetical protein